MKRVTVSTPFDDSIEYIMIENVDDVAAYQESLTGIVSDTCTRLIKSKVKPDRWDHMLHRDEPGGVMYGALLSAKLKGSNPIFEAGPLIDQKVKHILESILNGERILINNNGGYCPFSEDYHTLITSEPYQLTRPDNVTINENTRYINLENDPELEQHTIDYLSLIDPNFSYVCYLRDYDTEQLIDVFNQFQDNGGHTVYVYTTGIDIPQMYDYSDAIIESGITNVQFDFNSGQTEEHNDVIRYLEEHNVTVEVLP